MDQTIQNQLKIKARYLLLWIYKTTEMCPETKPDNEMDSLRHICITILAYITRGLNCCEDHPQFWIAAIKLAQKLKEDLKEAYCCDNLKQSDYQILNQLAEEILKIMNCEIHKTHHN